MKFCLEKLVYLYFPRSNFDLLGGSKVEKCTVWKVPQNHYLKSSVYEFFDGNRLKIIKINLIYMNTYDLRLLTSTMIWPLYISLSWGFQNAINLFLEHVDKVKIVIILNIFPLFPYSGFKIILSDLDEIFQTIHFSNFEFELRSCRKVI